MSELDSWTGEPLNKVRLFDIGSASLRAYIDGSEKSPIALLSNVGCWYGQTGARKVLHSDPSGWIDISNSLEYVVWHERTLFAALDNKSATTIHMGRSIFAMLHCICSRLDDKAIWFGNRIISTLIHDSAQKARNRKLVGWQEAPLYGFALRLFAIWKGLPSFESDLDVQPLGIYEDVLDSWFNLSKLEQNLAVACDYHVHQAFDDSDNDTQEFFVPLYDLFPVEILAIKRIREDLGQPIPNITHPLLQTTLAEPPSNLVPSNDQLLNEVSSKVCHDFSLLNPWK